MKKFRLKADVTFEAENLDHAFRVLSDHFKTVAYEGLEASSVFRTGELELHPEPVKSGDTWYHESYGERFSASSAARIRWSCSGSYYRGRS